MPNDDSILSSGRMLDQDKTRGSLELASSLGADYAEIRLVSETTNTASLTVSYTHLTLPTKA